MRAAIYARVSSDMQRDRHTIEGQLHELPVYVKSQGWTLSEKYIDDGRSAKTGTLERRDAWARLMRDAEAGKFDVLVVVDVNRLTRTNSIEERALVLGPLQRLGISVATPSGGVLDLRSFLGEFWVTIQALVAAEENRKRAEAIARGRKVAIAENRKPGGPTPFGWKYTRADGWSIDPPAAELVREIFVRVAKGESCIQVADDLVARDAQPAPRTGWSRSAIYRIVRKRTAVGEFCAEQKTRTVHAIPPIVTEEQWQATASALLAHRKRGLRKTRHVYLLEGLGVCGVCGSPMYIRSATFNPKRVKPVPAAYICRSRKVDARHYGPSIAERCGAPIFAVEDADTKVWALVEEVLKSPDLVAEIQKRLDSREANRRNWEGDAKQYRQRLDRLSKAESAVLARFRRGTVSEAAMDRELAEIERERKTYEAQLKTARTQAARSDAKASAEEIAAALRSLATSITPESRRRVVATIVAEAVFKPNGAIRVDFRVEDPTVSGVALVQQAVYKRQHEEPPGMLRLVRTAR